MIIDDKEYIDNKSNPEKKNPTQDMNVKIFRFGIIIRLVLGRSRMRRRDVSLTLFGLGEKGEFNVVFGIFAIHRIL